MEKLNSVREMPICPQVNMDKLVGKIMLLIESAVSYEAEAPKSLAKQLMWEWYDTLPLVSSLNDSSRLDEPSFVGALLSDSGKTKSK